MMLLDLLGRRWALRILWELREQPLGFTELQARCDTMSPSVLNQRLGELRDAGIIELRENVYTATAAGRRLNQPLLALNDWANAWAHARRPRDTPRARHPGGTARASRARAARTKRATGR
jgi:DNA-binding HxlR family transcriptional regulator